MGRRPAGTKPPRGLGGSWRVPREPLCLTCLGLATPLSSLPGCCVCPLSSGPTEAPALESYHPTLLGDASLVTRDTPHLAEAAACPLPLSLLGPPFLFAGMAVGPLCPVSTPSATIPRAAKGPPWAPLLSCGAHAVRPRGQPCLAGRREHVPVRAASGSWAHTGPLQVTGGPLPGAACGPLCTLCPGPPPSPAIKRYPPAPLAHHLCLCPVTTPPPAPVGSWGPAGCGRDRTIAPS